MQVAVPESIRRWAGGTLRNGVTATLLSLLACCASAPPQTFDLTAPPFAMAVRAPRSQIVVTEPLALSPADSDRIVVRPTPETVATLKGAQWVDRLPRLMQTRLVETFENARLLHSVGRPESQVTAVYQLNTEIRRFEIDFSSGLAVVEIAARLVAVGSGRVAAAQMFTGSAAGSAADAQAAAHALDVALTEVMRRMVVWTAAST